MTNRGNLWVLLAAGLKVLAVAALLALPACHTMQGVGRDVEGLGSGLSGAATDVGNELGADMNR